MKTTKLVPITSLDQLEVGKTIIKSLKFRRKILAKCGELVWLNYGDEINQDVNSPVLWDSSLPCSEPLNLQKLQNHDYQLEVTEEPWRPKVGEKYYTPTIVGSFIDVLLCTWINSDLDKKRLPNNIVCKTKEEATAKAQKMLDSIKDSE